MKENTVIVIFFVLNLIAFIFFVFDVILDFNYHIANQQLYQTNEFIHLVFELLAVIALGSGIFVTRKYLKKLQNDREKAERSLYYLRSDFDALAETKFNEWRLTSAEKDIAIFLLRGLSTANIAEHRHTQIGTIKLQIHKILQKAGVSTRIEFLSLFMDEFLDISME